MLGWARGWARGWAPAGRPPGLPAGADWDGKLRRAGRRAGSGGGKPPATYTTTVHTGLYSVAAPPACSTMRKDAARERRSPGGRSGRGGVGWDGAGRRGRCAQLPNFASAARLQRGLLCLSFWRFNQLVSPPAPGLVTSNCGRCASPSPSVATGFASSASGLAVARPGIFPVYF